MSDFQPPSPEEQVEIVPPAPEEITIGNQFLSNIPVEDRVVVGKYINDWDKGVTQKFQEIHGSYQWVKDLGSQEDVVSFKALYDWIDQDPQGFYEQLGKAIAEMNEPEGTVPPVEQVPVTPSPAPIDDGVRQQLDGALKWIADQQAAAKAAEEDAALNNYITDLHKQHGDFDDDYVVAKMYRGMKADDAIQAYQALVQNHVNQAAQNQAAVPPFLSSGSVPANDVNYSKMSRNEAREAFNQLFEAAQRQQQ